MSNYLEHRSLTSDSRGQHAFGLTPSERVHRDQNNGRVFQAQVFDLEDMEGAGVIIEQSQAGLRVNIETGEEQLITSERQLIGATTKVFREADNSCLRDSLGCFMSSDDDDESLNAGDKSVERSDNLKNFEYCTLEEEEESKVFLNGALKITRTSFEGPFHFYGRIEQEQADFDKVVDFLEQEESMVNHCFY